MSVKLMDYFNKVPRLGSLSTAAKDGKVNVGVFGSPKMVDERKVVMGLRKNRTFANLQENPFAVFMIMEPGKTVTEWRGLRVYLKMTGFKTEGEELGSIRAAIAARAGDAAAKTIHAAVTFEVYVRPLW